MRPGGRDQLSLTADHESPFSMYTFANSLFLLAAVSGIHHRSIKRGLTPEKSCGISSNGMEYGYRCDPDNALRGLCYSVNDWCSAHFTFCLYNDARTELYLAGKTAAYCGIGHPAAYGTCGSYLRPLLKNPIHPPSHRLIKLPCRDFLGLLGIYFLDHLDRRIRRMDIH